MLSKKLFFSAFYLTLLVLIGCKPEVQRSEKPNVVATTTLIEDMVRSVGGEHITITALMGPSVDPHLYKASALDVIKLHEADVIFYNGLMLEGRMGDVFNKLSTEGARLYPVTRNIPESELLAPPEMNGHWDPHVWFDPQLWAQCVDVVIEGLSLQKPELAETFQNRGAALKKRYEQVNTWAEKRLAELPKRKRVLVTSHDAYNYFGRAYGFEVIGVQGISTVSEAGLADVTSTVDFIKKRQIKAIFVESSVSPSTIERISQDSGASIGGELFSDALGTPGDMETGPDGETYDLGSWSGMMKHNINTLVESF
ncbi:MAG: zinc ABC transporter substrate-binding protein [Opitutales bacterium]